MKNFTSIMRLIAVFVSVVFMSTAFTNDANAQGVFQKRKHRKGFYIDFGKNKKSTNPSEAATEFEEAEVSINAKPAANIEEQAYELPFINETPAYEEVAIVAEQETEVETKITKPNAFIGFTEKAIANPMVSRMEKVKSLKQKLDPKSQNAQSELDPQLRKAIIFVAIGLILEVIGSIMSALFVFGLGWLIYLIGAIFIIVGLVFFVLWLVDNI